MKINKTTKSFTAQIVKAIQPTLKDRYKSFSASDLIGESARRLKRKLDEDEDEYAILFQPFEFPLGIVQSMKDVNESVVEWELKDEELITSLYEQIIERLGTNILTIEFSDALSSSNTKVSLNYDTFVLGLFLVQVIKVLRIIPTRNGCYFNQFWNKPIPAHLDREILSATICQLEQSDWLDNQDLFHVTPTNVVVTTSRIVVSGGGTVNGRKVPEILKTETRERNGVTRGDNR